MSTVRIWVLESDYDEKVVQCLAEKLTIHLQLNNLSIKTAGKRALTSIQRRKHAKPLKVGIRNFLKEDDYVIFVLDLDDPQSLSARRAQANSLINQVEEIVNEPIVCFAPIKWEIEAWLLIDCLGIFCYFASNRKKQFRQDCRQKVEKHKKFAPLVNQHQKGNTEVIVGAGTGNAGTKECLRKLSEEILQALNPKMSPRDINRERYKENMSPEIAEHIEISVDTLGRNRSLGRLGRLLSRFN